MKRALIIITLLNQISATQAFEALSKTDQNNITQVVEYARASKLGPLVEKFPCLKQAESAFPLPLLCIERGLATDVYPRKEMSALLEVGIPIDQKGKKDQGTALTAVGAGFAYWKPNRTLKNHDSNKPCKTTSIIEGLLNHRADQTQQRNGYTPLESALMTLDQHHNKQEGPWALKAVTLYIHNAGFSSLAHEQLSQDNRDRWPTYLNAVLKTTAHYDKRTELIRYCLKAGARARPEDLDDARSPSVHYLLKRDLDNQTWPTVLLDSQEKNYTHADTCLKSINFGEDVCRITLAYAGFERN